jgi:hypothetical protein
VWANKRYFKRKTGACIGRNRIDSTHASLGAASCRRHPRSSLSRLSDPAAIPCTVVGRGRDAVGTKILLPLPPSSLSQGSMEAAERRRDWGGPTGFVLLALMIPVIGVGISAMQAWERIAPRAQPTHPSSLGRPLPRRIIPHASSDRRNDLESKQPMTTPLRPQVGFPPPAAQDALELLPGVEVLTVPLVDGQPSTVLYYQGAHDHVPERCT